MSTTRKLDLRTAVAAGLATFLSWLAAFVSPAIGQPVGGPGGEPWRPTVRSMPEGMGIDLVTDVLEKDGVLWVTTYQGLRRYDGSSLRVYQHEENNPRSLAVDLTVRLLEDRHGSLWVCGQGAIQRYRPRTDDFEVFPFAEAGVPELEDAICFSLTEAEAEPGAKGALWVGTNKGLLYLATSSATSSAISGEQAGDDSGATFRFFEQTLGFPISGEVLRRGETELWIPSSRGGLHILNTVTGELTAVPAPIEGSFGSFCLLERPDGEIWVGSNPGLYRIVDPSGDPRLEAVVLGEGGAGQELLSQRRFNHLLADGSGTLWLASSQGLFAFDERSGRLHQMPVQPGAPLALGSRRVMRLHLDAEGTLWIGSLDGLYHAELRSRAFLHLHPGFQSAETAVSEVAASPSGRLFVATRGEGLKIWDPERGWVHHRADAASHSISASDAPASDVLRAVALDADGGVWIGGDGGLQRFDPESGRFTGFQLPSPDGMDGGSELVDSLLVDGDRVLAGQSRALAVLDRRTGNVHYVGAEMGLPAGLVTVARRATGGGYWIGSLGGGVAHLAQDLSRLTPLDLTGIGAGDRPSGLINDLLDDGDSLWIATMEGVLELDLTTRRIRSADSPIARLDKPASLLRDADGGLWVSTMKQGLLRFDPENGELIHLRAGDGLWADFLSNSTWLPDGRIAVAGNHGVVIFDPRKARGNPVRPRATAELAAGRQDSPPEPFADGARLAHDRNTIRIRLAGTSLTEPERNRFRYRLEGFDTRTHEVDVDGLDLRYTLPPGRYALHAAAANATGRWGPEQVIARFTIASPPWLRWWAWCAYALAFVGLVLFAVRVRTRLILRLNRKLERQVETKTHELARSNREIAEQAETIRRQLEEKEYFVSNVSHELRTPLTVIRGLMLKAATPESVSEAEIEVMERNIHRLLRRVDQLLELGKTRALAGAEQAVEPISLEELVRSAELAFGPLCRAHRLELEIEVRQPAVITGSQEAMETIVGNLLSNAVKYTPSGGRVTLRCDVADDHGVLEVADTGVGFSEGQLDRVFEPYTRLAGGDGRLAEGRPGPPGGFGLGLALVRELVSSAGGELTVESEPGRGTCFTLRFPRFEGKGADVMPGSEGENSAASLHRESKAAEHALDQVSAVSEPDPEQAKADGRPTLLLVDDEQDLRDYLRRLFTADYQLLEAADGESALRLAREHVPDAVVSDVMMPVMDGFELTAALRDDDRTCHIPIVLLTARDTAEARLRGFELRADDFVTKPFDETLLRSRVANLLEIRAVLRSTGAWRGPRDPESETAAKPSKPSGEPSGEPSGPSGEPSGPSVNPTDLSPRDRRFLERFFDTVDEMLADSEATVGDLAAKLYLSESQLRRKLRALTGQSPTAHLRQRRLQAAAHRLRQGESIQDALFGCGFTSQSHFSNCFKAAFGVTPGQFADDPRGITGESVDADDQK